MKLAHDWWEILKRAWSVRCMLLAAFLSPLAIALPIIEPLISPRYLIAFALLVFAVNIAAIITRLLAQSNLPDA